MEETQLAELVLEAIDVCANPADNFEHFVDDTYCSGSQTGPACESNIGTVTPGAYLCPSADPMLEYVNTYALDEWTSKGNYAVCWGNDDYLDFDPFVSMSPEIKLRHGAFHIVMLES